VANSAVNHAAFGGGLFLAAIFFNKHFEAPT
jgi:hypothetical protein